MRFRTADQLHAFLAGDLIWRKRELTQLKFLLEGSKTKGDQVRAILRSCITILYAHWEGFVKAAGIAYLEFLAAQALPYSSLTPNFVALAIRRLLNKAAPTRKAKFHIEVVEFLLEKMNEPSNIPFKDGISTRANLSSDVLMEILETLGLDPKPYEAKAVLIDEGLLKSRNTIAHGEYLEISEDRYEELYHEILAMMEEFRNQIDNAVAVQAFLAAA